jgi:hypothetical protein
MDDAKRRRGLPRPSSVEGRARLRSFAVAGLIGAAGALATARRLRRAPHRPRSAAGLAAFEDAPCFREIVELEGRGQGERPPDA